MGPNPVANCAASRNTPLALVAVIRCHLDPAIGRRCARRSQSSPATQGSAAKASTGLTPATRAGPQRVHGAITRVVDGQNTAGAAGKRRSRRRQQFVDRRKA